jgi:hypothetical protein
VWSLLNKATRPSSKVNHLLCQGFQKASGFESNEGNCQPVSIPGILSLHPNSHFRDMKAAPWPEILHLLGRTGERVMIDLILDCGIYTSVESGRDNYCQLSGKYQVLLKGGVCNRENRETTRGSPNYETGSEIPTANANPSSVIVYPKHPVTWEHFVRQKPPSLCSTSSECQRSRYFWITSYP